MQLSEFLEKHADKLANVPNAAEVGKAIAEAAKAAGFDLLANNVADQQNPTYVPKHRLDEVVGQKNTLKDEIKTRDEQLAALGKQVKDNEPLANQVKDFQTANEQLQGQLKTQALDFAIERGLRGANAKFPDLLIGKVDRTKLEMADDGATVKGLDDQIKQLQEGYKDLFGPAAPPVGGPSNPPPAGGTNFASVDRAAAAAEAAKYGIRL